MTARAIHSDLLRAYMDIAGWEEQPPGPAGSLWRHSGYPEWRIMDAGLPIGVIAVPDGLEEGSLEWNGVIVRLAAFEGRPLAEVISKVRNLFFDVTRLRAANDLVITGSIPLSAGTGLVGAAYRIVRAAATTSQRPRSQIAGNFSKVGDRITSQARLGHTEEGSYILPILMPLIVQRYAEEDLLSQQLGVERVLSEPAERRVTRTMAESLTAVQSRIIEPAREPTTRDVGPLVAAGVSRELIMALHEIISDPAVATFEARFDWSPAVTKPASIPASVTVPAEASDLLSMMARLLARPRAVTPETITGPIVEVRHLPGDPLGEVALQSPRRGRSVEIRVRLQRAQLDDAHDWMRSGRTVVAEGRIQRTPGRTLRMDAPTDIYPLDLSFLPL